jgi:hypothetical protein
MRPNTTDDLNRRFDKASQRVAKRIQLGEDPYDAAAYGGPGKAAFDGYPALVGAVIRGEKRVHEIYLQGGDTSPQKLHAVRWLELQDYCWVHCFSNNMPKPTPYRVYVCSKLSQTHNVLRQLLQEYAGHLYFKVATHAEAQKRNDTIVSWHQTFAEARQWANIAIANVSLLEGTAPAGTFGGLITYSVGIDHEVEGDTSTSRVARAGFNKALLKNPYI